LQTSFGANTKKLVFASSANPSRKGNSGRVAGIGQRISDEADLVIGADEFVGSNQPGTNEHTRYEQGDGIDGRHPGRAHSRTEGKPIGPTRANR